MTVANLNAGLRHTAYRFNGLFASGLEAVAKGAVETCLKCTAIGRGWTPSKKRGAAAVFSILARIVVRAEPKEEKPSMPETLELVAVMKDKKTATAAKSLAKLMVPAKDQKLVAEVKKNSRSRAHMIRKAQSQVLSPRIVGGGHISSGHHGGDQRIV
jgi:hypothetical protein